MSHPDHSHFQQLFDAALQDYERQTGKRLVAHPLAKQLEACESADSVTNVFQEQARGFHQSSGDHGKIMKSLKYAVDVLDRLSTNVIGPSIGLSYPPASVIFTGFAILLSAANDVSASHEALVDLFEFIETFLIRLEIYTNIPSTTVMTGVVVKIMVELLSTLAVVTKQISQGRPKKFLKKLIGEKDVEAVLQKLDRLAQDESRTTSAQSLQAIYSLFKNMRVIMDDGKAVADDVQKVIDMINRVQSDKLQRNVRKWLSAPDPWINHNTACDTQQKGSATWFIEGSVFSEWKSSGASSLLLIYGKPGAGKTVFCSSIIQDISCRERSEPATVAFFYCDFRDAQKKDLRGLLSSLLVQLCDQSDDYFALLYDFYSAHRSGSQHARDSELENCLKDMLKHPGEATVYVVIDALDEFPSTTGTPSPRDKLLKLVKDLIELKVPNGPNLRICVTSRLEADIVPVLNPLASHSISLHDEIGQIQDIAEYVKSVVNADHKMRQWKETDKELVVDVLTKKADGMFRWVICQWDDIRYCPPVRIRRALDELPETLDDTYARTLKDIQNWEDAHRLFQCISAAHRPLRVEELAEFLAFDFDGSSTPTLEEDHRLGDPAQAVLATCSSLVAVVNADGSQVVQFAHFSVKEYLTSARLAEEVKIISRFHVSMTPAHTIVAQACLGVLLHLHENPTEDTLKELPLAEYAARYWVGHAQFENVSPRIEDQMKRLFDPKKHHLAAWVRIYDPILRSDRFGRSQLPSQVKATPLLYAAVCGLPDVVRFLIVECSQDINARDSQHHETPLEMAFQVGDHDLLEVSRVLLEYGGLNQVPSLCVTRQEISRGLLEHSVGVALATVAHTLSQNVQLSDGIPLNESIFFGASVGSCVRALVSASPKLRAFLAMPIILLYSFAFLSNSYTLLENRAVLFFLIYTLIPPLITALSTRTAHLRYRIFAFSALFLASIMLTGVIKVCSEEQHSWCPIVFSSSGAASLPGLVRVLLIPVAALVPYGMRRALAISKYEKGAAYIFLPAIITPALILCSACWLLKWLDACGIYPYPTNLDLDRTGHAVAWTSMFTVLGGTALWALVNLSWQRATHRAAVGVAINANIYTFCAVIAYFWAFVLVRVWLVAQVSAEVSIALANVSLFAYIELADAARDARALRVYFEAEPAGALERLEYSLLITMFMPLFWVATVMVDLMVLFIFLKPVSFVSGHQETLLCTQWKAGFVVTPEVSRLSPLLEVFSTFVCAAAVGLIIPLIYTGSRILFQGVAPALLVLLVIALERRLSQPELRRRMSQFYVTVREMDPLQYVVASLFGIVFSGLWLWRHFMA